MVKELNTSFNPDDYTRPVEILNADELERFMHDSYVDEFYLEFGKLRKEIEVDIDDIHQMFQDGTLEPGIYGVIYEYSEVAGKSSPVAFLDPDAFLESLRSLKKDVEDTISMFYKEDFWFKNKDGAYTRKR